MPKGSNYLTIGWKQVFLALKELRYLPQIFIYLVALFLLADGLNTTGTLVSIIQNNIVSFSFLKITYLGLSQAACSITSTFGFCISRTTLVLRRNICLWSQIHSASSFHSTVCLACGRIKLAIITCETSGSTTSYLDYSKHLTMLMHRP
jgi:MFS-type transporter involved in bile tolerance (Atg22 family)